MRPQKCALAGSLALLVSGVAGAAVTGLHFELDSTQLLDGLPRNVWRLYADTNNANDVVLAQSGLDLTDRRYEWSNDLLLPFDNLGTAGFWNSGFGDDRATFNEAIIGSFPTVLFDTYMTIGVDSGVGNGPDASSFAPGTNVFGLDDTFVMSSGANGQGAMFITPDDLQGAPDAQGRVLLAQITTLATEHVSVRMNIDWANSEEGRGANRGYFTTSTVPAPGALALLGLAGLASRRRRRA